jgi:putative phage-type endonuclease
MARLTEAQVAQKRTTLGASAFGALAGVNPWQTDFALYLEMIGELDPDANVSEQQARARERGHRFEDVALQWYADEKGVAIEHVRRDVVHPRYPFIVVHPDARVKPWRTTRTLVEAKTSRSRWDQVPQHVEAQCQAQMAATGAQRVDVALLTFDGLDVFEVPRNDELIAALEELAVSFMDRVARRDPPPVDGSRAASQWLDRMFLDVPEVQADPDQAGVLARLLAIRSEVDRLEAEDKHLVNILKFSMAGAPRLYAPGVGKVLWTAPGERRSTSWKDVAADYRFRLEQDARDRWEGDLLAASIAGLDEIEATHTTTAEGVRTFRVTPAKEKAA